MDITINYVIDIGSNLNALLWIILVVVVLTMIAYTTKD